MKFAKCKTAIFARKRFINDPGHAPAGLEVGGGQSCPGWRLQIRQKGTPRLMLQCQTAKLTCSSAALMPASLMPAATRLRAAAIVTLRLQPLPQCSRLQPCSNCAKPAMQLEKLWWNLTGPCEQWAAPDCRRLPAHPRRAAGPASGAAAPAQLAEHVRALMLLPGHVFDGRCALAQAHRSGAHRQKPVAATAPPPMAP